MSVNTVSTNKPEAFERNSESEQAALEQTWREPAGIRGWLSNVDHKSIGKRFILTAFAFFILGGILAILMRVQLARPENNILGPDLYNQIFTMHGSTMMFLFAVPVMDAMAIYLIPLMVGTRGIALSRLNAFGYWIYLFGGLFLYAFFLFNVGPDNGWFSYVVGDDGNNLDRRRDVRHPRRRVFLSKDPRAPMAAKRIPSRFIVRQHKHDCAARQPRAELHLQESGGAQGLTQSANLAAHQSRMGASRTGRTIFGRLGGGSLWLS